MHVNPYQPPADDDPVTQPGGGVLSRNIELRGSLPIGDVLHTQILILRQRWPYVAFCFLIYLLFVALLVLFNREQTLFANTFLVLCLIIMPGILPLSLLLVFLRLKRDADRRVGIFAATQSKITQTGIEASLPGHRVSLPWSAFRGFLYSTRVVILFLRKSNSHLIVSRQKLRRPDDWPLLVAFLHERLPRC